MTNIEQMLKDEQKENWPCPTSDKCLVTLPSPSIEHARLVYRQGGQRKIAAQIVARLDLK